MSWLLIGILLLLGLIFLILEIVFVPGTTIVGIVGGILTIAGIFFSFQEFGMTWGFIITGAAFFANLLALVIALKSGTWEKLGLKTQNKSRVNDDIIYHLNEGDIGESVSALRPSGKVAFNNEVFEASTHGEYVDARQKVRIIEIRNKSIFVESLIKYQKQKAQ